MKQLLLIGLVFLGLSLSAQQSKLLFTDTYTGTDVTIERTWALDFAGVDYRQGGFLFKDRVREIITTPLGTDTTFKNKDFRFSINDTLTAFGQDWWYDKIYDWVYGEQVPDGTTVLIELNKQMLYADPVTRYTY